MTLYTDADLLDAIDKARKYHADWCCTGGCIGHAEPSPNQPENGSLWVQRQCDESCNCDVGWHDAHLDTLRAILDLHRCRHDEGGTMVAPFSFCPECDGGWPCRTVQIVADTLTGMAALDGDDNTSEVCMIPGCGCDGRSHA